MTAPAFPAPARAVVAVLLGWCVLHLALRIALIDVMEVDHVEQAVAAQGLAVSYGPKQPPLYTWLQLGANRLLGVGQGAFVALKYALIAVFLVAYYGAARRMGMARDVAALAVGSLSLLYQIGWKFHFGVTHTLLLSVAVALAPFALARGAARPGPWTAASVGAALGLGLMAKYGFAAYVIAFVAATATVPALARAWTPGRVAIAVLAAGAVASPIAWFVLTRLDTVSGVFNATMTAEADAGVFAGLTALVLATLGFLAPLVLVVAAVYPRVFVARVPHAGTAESGPSPADWDRWFAVFHAVIAVMLLALVLVGGVDRFKERWMHPFLLLVPMWWSLRAGALYTAARRRRRIMLGIVVGWSAFVVGYRVALDTIGPPLCSGCRQFTPYEVLETAIAPRSARFVSFLAEEEHLAGNLKVRFPDKAVFTPVYPGLGPARFGMVHAGACALVWRGEDPVPPPALRADLAARFETRWPEGGTSIRVRVPLADWRRRFPRWEADEGEAAFAWRFAIVEGCGAMPRRQER